MKKLSGNLDSDLALRVSANRSLIRDFKLRMGYAGRGRVTERLFKSLQPAGRCKSTKDVSGSPDPKHISTSFVERQNWSVRTIVRRYTRKSNGFNRKMENHAAATALNYSA